MCIEILFALACLGQQPHTPAADSPISESVEVRYARAQLQLAEVNLDRVEQSNKKVAGAVPSSVVAEYQYDVEVARIRLEQATTGQAARRFQVWLERASAELKTAEMNWKKATAANRRVPGTFGPLEVDRFRLRAEVAKLQLERGQALVDSSREAQLQWQVELLDNQVQRMKEESRRATSTITFSPYLWW